MSAQQIFQSQPSKNLRVNFKAKGSAGSQKKDFKPDVSDVVIIAPGDQTEPRDVVLYRSKEMTFHSGFVHPVTRKIMPRISFILNIHE